MTNKEKYAKEILDVVCLTGKHPALVHGNIYVCINTFCERCRFGGSSNCTTQFIKWVKEEYKEPEIDWTKVPVDTKILVRDYKDASWYKAHFASYKDGKPFAFPWGRSSWTVTPSMSPIAWSYTEIADPDERKKYLKYE